MGKSRKNICEFPDSVKGTIGHGLDIAQCGGKHDRAKPLKGFKGSGVLELVEDFDGDTYRAVYTVKFTEAVYVLHVFQKKSKTGIATQKQDIELVKDRFELARLHYTEYYENQST
jgi:phage-related protein